VFGRFLKRLIDVVGALGGLLVTAPLYPVAAIVIKIDSPGPVVYRQTRIGLAGRAFTCYKLRTYYADADDRKERTHAEIAATQPYRHPPDDPLVTRTGRFLRKASLNELPQFLNVLKGDMSLVGPRPTLPVDVRYYAYRQQVKPGLTSLWQVSGRSDLDVEAGMELDRWYIERWSLWLDLKIICLTPRAVFSRRGAA